MCWGQGSEVPVPPGTRASHQDSEQHDLPLRFEPASASDIGHPGGLCNLCAPTGSTPMPEHALPPKHCHHPHSLQSPGSPLGSPLPLGAFSGRLLLRHAQAQAHSHTQSQDKSLLGPGLSDLHDCARMHQERDTQLTEGLASPQHRLLSLLRAGGGVCGGGSLAGYALSPRGPSPLRRLSPGGSVGMPSLSASPELSAVTPQPLRAGPSVDAAVDPLAHHLTTADTPALDRDSFTVAPLDAPERPSDCTINSTSDRSTGSGPVLASEPPIVFQLQHLALKEGSHGAQQEGDMLLIEVPDEPDGAKEAEEATLGETRGLQPMTEGCMQSGNEAGAWAAASTEGARCDKTQCWDMDMSMGMGLDDRPFELVDSESSPEPGPDSLASSYKRTSGTPRRPFWRGDSFEGETMAVVGALLRQKAEDAGLETADQLALNRLLSVRSNRDCNGDSFRGSPRRSSLKRALSSSSQQSPKHVRFNKVVKVRKYRATSWRTRAEKEGTNV